MNIARFCDLLDHFSAIAKKIIFIYLVFNKKNLRIVENDKTNFFYILFGYIFNTWQKN